MTTTLVSGERDAILIDPQFLASEARTIAAEIKKTGKNVTTIYTTHADADHFFGIASMRQDFPNAKYVALPVVVERMKLVWPARRTYWLKTYGDDLPGEEPVLPEPLVKPELTLEGETFEIHGGLMGDGPDNSFVWIPSIKAAIAGDIVFHRSHFGVPTDPTAWLASLDKIAALQPAIVVAGHQAAGTPNDPQAIDWMKGYMSDFAAFKAEAQNGPELKEKMLAKYPGLALEELLDGFANKAFLPQTKQ